MSDNVEKTFGYIIAFIAPGFVALWGLSRVENSLESWLGGALKGPTTVGDFLLVVLASIALGVFVSGLRWIVFDLGLMKVLKVPAEKADPLMERDADVRAAIDTFRQHHYRYYQFYANTAIALILVLAVINTVQAYVVGVMAEGVLIASARDAFIKFRIKTNDVCKGVKK